MASLMDYSFDGRESEHVDLASVIAEFPSSIEEVNNVNATKKLSDEFETCAKNESHMKVFLRVRPISSKCESTISVGSETTIITSAPEVSRRAQYTKKEERHYVFNRVFGPSSPQTEIFDHVVSPLVEKFLVGESCVLFAYGMTNAGKTYTIQGSPQLPGMFPLLINHILNRTKGTTTYELELSMLEIYQEKIYDLLAKRKDKLTIRDGNGRVEVSKLSQHSIASSDDAIKLLDLASQKRSKAHTLLNTGSSRSHAVYTLSLRRLINGQESIAVFQVVDLAGAERGNRTKASVAQQKEANNINMSLMQLWRCLQGMRKKNSDAIDIIPFRESKLTHLLMPQLSRAGTSGVAMITCVNPQVEDYDETLSILANASVAYKIKEIMDIGRNHTANVNPNPAPLSTMSSHRSSVLATVPVQLTGATHEDKPKSEVKKRKLNTSKSSSILSTASARDSAVSTSTNGTVATTNVVSFDGKSRKDSTGSIESTGNDVNDMENEREVKRLRIYVDELNKQNDVLRAEGLSREKEIRKEVSEEFAKRSADLLSQLESLQEQLYEKETAVEDVTKSCKKLARKHKQLANENAIRDLAEAEEELERVKSAYEKEISQLQVEKTRLQTELKIWKDKAEVAMRAVEAMHSEQQFRTKMGGPVTSVRADSVSSNSSIGSCGSSAQEFSQRMQRDARFKKSQEAAVAAPAIAVPSVVSDVYCDQKNIWEQSLRQRSPLSPLKNDGNSPPIRLDQLNHGKKSPAPAARSPSPIKGCYIAPLPSSSRLETVNDENADLARTLATPYGKRLRSHNTVRALIK